MQIENNGGWSLWPGPLLRFIVEEISVFFYLNSSRLCPSPPLKGLGKPALDFRAAFLPELRNPGTSFQGA